MWVVKVFFFFFWPLRKHAGSTCLELTNLSSMWMCSHIFVDLCPLKCLHCEWVCTKMYIREEDILKGMQQQSRICVLFSIQSSSTLEDTFIVFHWWLFKLFVNCFDSTLFWAHQRSQNEYTESKFTQVFLRKWIPCCIQTISLSSHWCVTALFAFLSWTPHFESSVFYLKQSTYSSYDVWFLFVEFYRVNFCPTDRPCFLFH